MMSQGARFSGCEPYASLETQRAWRPRSENHQARFTTSFFRFAKNPERLLHYLGHPRRLAGKKIQVAVIYRPDLRFSHGQSPGLENRLAAAQRCLPDHLKRDQLSIRRCRTDSRSESHKLSVV